MKVKNIFCLLAALGISSHAFAMEIYKGKVLSQKVWSSDGGKATLKVNKAMLGMHAARQPLEHTWAHLSSASTKVNRAVEIPISTGVSVLNFSDETHIYHTIQSVCSETPEATMQCVYYEADMELSPGGYLVDDLQPVLEMIYSKPGNYRISALSSYDEDSNPASYTESKGVMTVS